MLFCMILKLILWEVHVTVRLDIFQDNFSQQVALMWSLIARFMGPKWGPSGDRQDPGGPHVGPMDLAIWDGKVNEASNGQHIAAWTWALAAYDIFKCIYCGQYFDTIHYRSQWWPSSPLHIFIIPPCWVKVSCNDINVKQVEHIFASKSNWLANMDFLHCAEARQVL